MAATTSSTSDPDSITGQLCTWISSLQLSDVPEDVVTRAKHLILDGVGCALIGSHLPWSEIAASGIFEMESEGPCTVIGWDDKKLPLLSAALLNSAFIQGFELDDYHSAAPLHSASILIPALLAAIEHLSAKQDPSTAQILPGAAFIKAFVAGCEVGPRVGLALRGKDLLTRGWHSGAVQGPAASAAAISSLLSLPPQQIEWAMGIAATQAGGLMSAQFGSMAKRMQHGFGARNGVFGALMARQGYTGIEKVFEVEYGGFLSMFGQGSKFDPKTLPEELTSGLGERWEINRIRVKLHAAMAALHGTIDCIDNLQNAHPALFSAERLGEIANVTTEHASAAYEHGGWKLPKDGTLTTVAAQMSIQYAAAAQLIDGEVLMAQYGADRLNRPLVKELANKVHPTHNKTFDESDASQWYTNVTVEFEDGTSVTEHVDGPKGIKPAVTNEDIVDKWRRLTRDVIDDDRRAAIERCILSLESVSDVREFVRLLAPSSSCPITVQ